MNQQALLKHQPHSTISRHPPLLPSLQLLFSTISTSAPWTELFLQLGQNKVEHHTIPSSRRHPPPSSLSAKMTPTDGKPSATPGPSRSMNNPDKRQRPARSGPPLQGQPAQWSAPHLDPQLQSLLQEPIPSNDNFVIATRCSTLDGSGLLFHGNGMNMLVPFTMLDEQNQLRFGHTGKYESLDWLAVANIQKPGPDFDNPLTVTSRTSREPQPPVRSNPSRPQPAIPQLPHRGRRSGRDATRGNTADNSERPFEDKRVGRSRGPR